MQSADEILRELNIEPRSTAHGVHYCICPQCSHLRKPNNRKLKCLGVTIDERGVVWCCNHCAWSGGQQYNNNASTAYTSRPRLGSRSVLRDKRSLASLYR